MHLGIKLSTVLKSSRTGQYKTFAVAVQEAEILAKTKWNVFCRTPCNIGLLSFLGFSNKNLKFKNAFKGVNIKKNQNYNRWVLQEN